MSVNNFSGPISVQVTDPILTTNDPTFGPSQKAMQVTATYDNAVPVVGHSIQGLVVTTSSAPANGAAIGVEGIAQANNAGEVYGVLGYVDFENQSAHGAAIDAIIRGLTADPGENGGIAGIGISSEGNYPVSDGIKIIANASNNHFHHGITIGNVINKGIEITVDPGGHAIDAITGDVIVGVNNNYAMFTRIAGGILKPWFATASGLTAFYNAAGGAIVFRNQADTAELLRMTDTGSIGIDVSNPQYLLDVAGYVHAISFSASSDKRWKRDIKPLTNCIDKIKQINGVRFKWTKEYLDKMRDAKDGDQIGFIAQELERIFPELVHTNKDGYKAVDYARAVPILWDALKDITHRIEILERK